MKVSIIVPTYKERENISKLFDRIFDMFKTNKISGEIIVVDDNSQDRTDEVVNRYIKKGKPVSLIVRKNQRGLASACVEGFKKAKGDIFLVMDADLQHPPEKIPDLINAINNGADIAIGSRYIEGGGTGNWRIGRRIISKGASGLANTLFKEIKNIKDKESGFFAFKKDVIKDVSLKPKGYKILLEILILGSYNKAVEVPYKFGLRCSGESKLGFNIIFSYISHIISLLWQTGKLIKFCKFCFVGLVGVVVNLGVLFILTNAGLHYMISGAISLEASVLANFFLNRAWTFKEEAKQVYLGEAILRDHATRFAGVLINYACLYIFTEIFGKYYIISMTIGIGIATMWNFLGNALWVWNTKN
jgi:dolichol-phosphate mannosyltransferase